MNEKIKNYLIQKGFKEVPNDLNGEWQLKVFDGTYCYVLGDIFFKAQDRYYAFPRLEQIAVKLDNMNNTIHDVDML